MQSQMDVTETDLADSALMERLLREGKIDGPISARTLMLQLDLQGRASAEALDEAITRKVKMNRLAAPIADFGSSDGLRPKKYRFIDLRG